MLKSLIGDWSNLRSLTEPFFIVSIFRRFEHISCSATFPLCKQCFIDVSVHLRNISIHIVFIHYVAIFKNNPVEIWKIFTLYYKMSVICAKMVDYWRQDFSVGRRPSVKVVASRRAASWRMGNAREGNIEANCFFGKKVLVIQRDWVSNSPMWHYFSWLILSCTHNATSY